MDFRQLRYFVRIVEVGSVSGAAQSLHVAQPALSKQVAQLEEELGVKLLARSVRGVTATEAGLAVFKHAQAILKQVDATAAVAQGAVGTVTGAVNIGLPWTLVALLGLDLLREVREKLPGVRLEITEGQSAAVAQMLTQGKLDLAIVFGTAPDATVRKLPLASEALKLVGAPGSFPPGQGASLRDAAGLPLLLLSRPNSIREELERHWADAGITPRVVAEINASSLLIAAVQAGLGFSMLPSCAIDEKLRAGSIEARELEGGRLRREVCLATSMLFPLSLAAERVLAVVVRLARQGVNDGRWDARLLGDPAPADEAGQR